MNHPDTIAGLESNERYYWSVYAGKTREAEKAREDWLEAERKLNTTRQASNNDRDQKLQTSV
jgi:hypothetical protein